MAGSNQWVVGESDEMMVTIENDEGYNVARVERMGKVHGGGGVSWTHSDVDADGEINHCTTDEQWQAIVDDIALAPEMLACLREVAHELPAIAGISAKTEQWVREIVTKAEPVRREKRTVKVEVEVSVMVEKGETLDADMLAARVRDHAFVGMHDSYGDDLVVRAKVSG